eukprot:gb/GFBE01074961.1/.p1 GENE.gb/GFBE01074961.1/~~gb/GFBE01074961.1/.p1  ORF type:complete len:302 (+),score=84.72 gb/GFBE01074961.1/:1-906(+)
MASGISLLAAAAAGVALHGAAAPLAFLAPRNSLAPQRLHSSRAAAPARGSAGVAPQSSTAGASWAVAGFTVVATVAKRTRRSCRAGRVLAAQAEAETTVAEAEAETTVVSPFTEGVQEEGKEGGSEEGDATAKAEKPKLALTWENVDTVLDELRPFLKSDGGNCKIVEIDGSIVKLELQGACSSCSSSSVTLKMGIEKTLRERIPEISEVVAVTPEQEKLSAEGVEEVLDGIRPFLSVSGGSIELFELVEGDDPKIVLKMIGPPLKSMAVRVEVQNRIKRKYPAVQEVAIVGEDGKPPVSA